MSDNLASSFADALGTTADDLNGHRREGAVQSTNGTVTLRVLTHELRTPINHILGYSEMLLEDLAEDTDVEGLRAMQVVRATGKQLLALVNTELGSAAGTDAVASPDTLAAVRLAVGRSIERIKVLNLETSRLGQSRAFAGDVVKILDATTRLAEFARVGTVRVNE